MLLKVYPRNVWIFLFTGLFLQGVTWLLNRAVTSLRDTQIEMLELAGSLLENNPDAALIVSNESRSVGAWAPWLLDLSEITNVAGLLAAFTAIGFAVATRFRKDELPAPDLGPQIALLLSTVEDLAAAESRTSEVLARVEEERRKTQVLIDMHPDQWDAVNEHGKPARVESRWWAIAGLSIALLIPAWQNFDKIATLWS